MNFFAVYAIRKGGKFSFAGKSLESAIHKALRDGPAGLHGEWFDLVPAAAIAAVKECALAMGAREITLADLSFVSTSGMERKDEVMKAQANLMGKIATTHRS